MGVTLDLDGQRVIREDSVERLTTREVALLTYLIDRAGHVVPRSEIFTEVWGYAPNVVSRAVDATMRRLRRKLRPILRIQSICLAPMGRAIVLSSAARRCLRTQSHRSRRRIRRRCHQLHLGAAETRLFGRRDDIAAIWSSLNTVPVL